MARDARLRLAEDRDEFADRQFGLAKQVEQAQPRDLARRLEPGQQAVDTQKPPRRESRAVH